MLTTTPLSTCYARLERRPVPGLRQLLVCPHDATSRPAGLLRERHLLLELDDGRVFSLQIPRGWLPTPPHLSSLVSALFECRGTLHNRSNTAQYLNWQLETTLTLEECNLTRMAPDRAAVRTLAIEHGLAIQPPGETSTGDVHVRVKALEQEITQEWDTLIASFIEGLGPDTLGQAGIWPDGMPLSRYNWLVGSDARTRNWRIQVARVFPALIPILAGERGEIQKSEAELTRVIDQGRPLIHALADIYGVRKAIARHALTMPAWLLDDERPARLGVLLRGLSALPPERYPRADDDWRMYVRLLYELLPSLTGRPPASVLNASFLPAISRRGWVVTARKLEGVGLNEEGSLLLRQFMTACNRMLAWAVVESTRTHELEATRVAGKVLDEAFLSIGVVGLADLARRWPACLGRSRLAHREWSEQVRGKRWPTVIDEPFQWEDCQVVALAGPEDLLEEGKAMNNCVATYVQACMYGDSFIYSVRGKGDERLATAEVRFSPDRGSNSHQFVIVQFKGPSNHSVCSQAARALGAFRRHLETDTDAQSRIAQVKSVMTKLRHWRRQGDTGRLGKRIEQEIERDALRQLQNARLVLDTLLAEAVTRLNDAVNGKPCDAEAQSGIKTEAGNACSD